MDRQSIENEETYIPLSTSHPQIDLKLPHTRQARLIAVIDPSDGICLPGGVVRLAEWLGGVESCAGGREGREGGANGQRSSEEREGCERHYNLVGDYVASAVWVDFR